MVVFWITAALMAVLACALVLVPLRRRRSRTDTSRDELNAAIFRERLNELDAERNAGRVDENQYRQLRAELERTLLADVPEDAKSAPQGSSLAVKLAMAAALLMPAGGVVYYYITSYQGEPGRWIATRERFDDLVKRALDDPEALAEATEADLPDLARVMQAQLLEEGLDDPDGLYLLGISYLQMQQVRPALFALERAYQLAPERPEVMLAFAQAILFAHEGRLTRDSEILLRRVLAANPHHQRALFLFGFGAFNAGDYQRAIQAWQSLLAMRDPASEGARLIRNSIARAEELMAQHDAQAPAPDQAQGPRIAVTVNLSPELQEQVSPQDTLFIFAKAAAGPPMPLAVVRQPVRGFPVEVVLDDSQAMMPSMKLSTFQEVVVGARISKAGTVAAQNGDLQGISDTIDLQNGRRSVALVIDEVIEE